MYLFEFILLRVKWVWEEEEEEPCLVLWEQTLPYLKPKLRAWGFESLPKRDLCQETRRKRKRLQLISKAGIHLV